MSIDFGRFITKNKIDTFDKFISNLSKQDIKVKGKYFEYFCKLYFKLLPSNKLLYDKIYLYDEIPIEIKEKLKLPQKDKGIDGILLKNKEIYAIQVKFRSDNKTIIPFGELATFGALTYGTQVTGITKGLFFTNCMHVCEELNNNKYIHVTYSCFDKCKKLFWKNVCEYISNKKITKHIPLTPLPHQLEIIRLIETYYATNTKGRLYLPCGCGKTFLGYWTFRHVLKYNSVFVVVPSLYLLSETFETWINELQNSKIKFLLIGSDLNTNITCEYQPTTNINIIKKELRSTKDIVVITTYHSSGLLQNACKSIKFKFDLGIFDEAHRTAGSNDRSFIALLDETYDVCEKKLFMTATEKIYYQKNKIDKVLSMDSIETYGKVICHYSTRKAIEDNQLVDYRVIAPFITKQYDTSEYIVLNKKTYDLNTLLTAIMIVNAFNTNKFTHLLIFSNKNKKAKIFNELLTYLLDDTTIYCKYLSGNHNMNYRKAQVKDFQDAKRGIISSAKIFGEGVNIPICDAICYADTKSSIVDIIQYAGRCLRKCNSKPDKIGYILIPMLIDEDNTNFFDYNNKSFMKLRTILKTLGTTDDLISEKFMLMNCNKDINHNNLIEKIIVGKEITELDLKTFSENILLHVFDKAGDQYNKTRNIIVNENKKRYNNKQELIDSQNKCLEYLHEQNITDIPETNNWIKYCLGDILFEQIKKQYYYNKDELKKACIDNKIYNFNDYKEKYTLDHKLPHPIYINDGFYHDIDNQFNLDILLQQNIVYIEF